MASYLSQMFDAPQRRVVFEQIKTSNGALAHLEFHIQGDSFRSGSREVDCPFYAMAELGISRWNQPRLTLFQRLMRKPARVGTISQMEQGQLMVTLWTDPELTFVLPTDMEGMPHKWKTCHGIIQAAGFELQRE